MALLSPFVCILPPCVTRLVLLMLGMNRAREGVTTSPCSAQRRMHDCLLATGFTEVIGLEIHMFQVYLTSGMDYHTMPYNNKMDEGASCDRGASRFDDFLTCRSKLSVSACGLLDKSA